MAIIDLADFSSGDCQTEIEVLLSSGASLPGYYSYTPSGRTATAISPYQNRYTETIGTIELLIYSNSNGDYGVDTISVDFKTQNFAVG